MTRVHGASRTSLRRREFMQRASACAAATLLASPHVGSAAEVPLRLATFRADISPPLGHPLCGGWIPPVAAQDDPLEAIGLVLCGSGEPIVLCSLDWTGLLNEAHAAWRQRLAEAAGTTPARVAVHCVHQHNAPFAECSTGGGSPGWQGARCKSSGNSCSRIDVSVEPRFRKRKVHSTAGKSSKWTTSATTSKFVVGSRHDTD